MNQHSRPYFGTVTWVVGAALLSYYICCALAVSTGNNGEEGTASNTAMPRELAKPCRTLGETCNSENNMCCNDTPDLSCNNGICESVSPSIPPCVGTHAQSHRVSSAPVVVGQGGTCAAGSPNGFQQCNSDAECGSVCVNGPQTGQSCLVNSDCGNGNKKCEPISGSCEQAPSPPTPPFTVSATLSLPSCTNQLGVNERLNQGEFVCSPDGSYTFGLDAAGADLSLWEGTTKLWSAVTGNMGNNTYLIMQDDGNAVVYSSEGVLWASNTEGNSGAYLTIENGGIVEIVYQGNAIWKPNLCNYLIQLPAAPPPGPSPPGLVPVNSSTLFNKVMAGYQGWFGTECDGGYNHWKHWSGSGSFPSPLSYQVDMWPDLTEYDTDELCPTGFHYSTGENAGVFSSFTAKTVERHVKWMYDYGVDGVFVQRFVSELANVRCIRDKITEHIRRGAEQYGRVFANMYDISGASEMSVYDAIRTDWMHLVDVANVTKSDRYLRHNGLPVLAIWGFGFASRVGEPQEVADLIDWFQNTAETKYRVTLMGGVPSRWRSRTNDAKTDQAWDAVYRAYDIISPWTVGRFANESQADNFLQTQIIPDSVECQNEGIDYMPVVFPGYSFQNTNPAKPFNEIPREGGHFFWRQFYNTIEVANSTQVYVAMFDEVDEATAIFKVAETSAQTPDDINVVTLDIDNYAVPSDWFLRLVGNATTMLRDSTPIPSSMPALEEAWPPACCPIDSSDAFDCTMSLWLLGSVLIMVAMGPIF